MSHKPKWRLWLDRDLNPRWIECLEDYPSPDQVEDLLRQWDMAKEKHPIVLGPDFVIQVQP